LGLFLRLDWAIGAASILHWVGWLNSGVWWNGFAQLSYQIIMGRTLLLEYQMNTRPIRVQVLNFIANPHKLAATFVFPLAPSHAQFAVFNPPFAGVA